ncbi:unnamed protein product [Didymodactylos carnosus]|uniref:CxC5 like cysteine cluster associated with KDZ domain-containing protein n=1 Tax=Didymodactylos carnosus TaxID=1234261 RepID=A0A8S2FT77_9BILA|nr:unnamed protein product [Didymodactylos carnosus]CAF4343141.1 unnamed protein product [Didymodactylos carnosus]
MVLLEVTDDEYILLDLVRQFSIEELSVVNYCNAKIGEESTTKREGIRRVMERKFGKPYSSFDISYIVQKICNLKLLKFVNSTEIDEQLAAEFEQTSSNSSYNTYLPFTRNCLRCGDSMLLSKKPKNVTVYKLNGVEDGRLYHCACDSCDIKYYPNTFIEGNRKYVNVKSLYHKQFIYFGGRLVFSVELFLSVSSSLLHQYSGFENLEKWYNCLMEKKHFIFYSDDLFSNYRSMKTDRHSLELQYFLYEHCLMCFSFYSFDSIEISFSMDRDAVLDNMMTRYNLLHTAFTDFWAHHRNIRLCNETCSMAFVSDG